MKILDGKIQAQIAQLQEQGDLHLENDDYPAAHELFIQAIELLPEPITDYVESTWLFAALGDVYFFGGNFELGLEAFKDASVCPHGQGNSFVQMRIGECAFELGDEQLATDALKRAFTGGGKEIFETEEPKYLEFLQLKLK